MWLENKPVQSLEVALWKPSIHVATRLFAGYPRLNKSRLYLAIPSFNHYEYTVHNQISFWKRIHKDSCLKKMPDTHPNKRRRGKERLRVTRACDTCKRYGLLKPEGAIDVLTLNAGKNFVALGLFHAHFAFGRRKNVNIMQVIEEAGSQIFRSLIKTRLKVCSLQISLLVDLPQINLSIKAQGE